MRVPGQRGRSPGAASPGPTGNLGGRGHSKVFKSRCALCLTCLRSCPFGVPVIDHQAHAAYIDPAKCHGCGVCAAECPHKAIQLMHYRDDQMLTEISAALEGTLWEEAVATAAS